MQHLLTNWRQITANAKIHNKCQNFWFSWISWIRDFSFCPK